MKVIMKDHEQHRWKEAMKEFASTNDDALFTHNYTGEYRMGNLEEFSGQMDMFQAQIPSLRLLEGNIKHFKYKNGKYVLITLNSEDEDFLDTDGNKLNLLAFSLNFMVSGYSYLFKKKSYKKIESGIRHRFVK